MGADVEFRNAAVTEELKYWARWLLESLPCDGFRTDAAKHIPHGSSKSGRITCATARSATCLSSPNTGRTI